MDKPLVWLHGEIKTPPFSREARIEAGVLLRRLQLVYRIDSDAIVLVDVFSKKTRQTPSQIIARSKVRLRQYDEIAG